MIPPTRIMDFAFLYARNCAGCHGPDGRGGVAIGLGDPVYLAIADDATINRITANGVTGTAMPAFARHSGGMLTDDQINVIVRGMRTRWARPASHRAMLSLHPTSRRLRVIRRTARSYTVSTARRVMAQMAVAARGRVPSWIARISRW